jgi:Pentapeptide repeats (9 copies)
MAENTGIADPWAGAGGPKIRPEPIEKTWRNDRDPTRRRATFEVSYPLWEITIEKSDDLREKLPSKFEKTDRRVITGVRFHLKVPITFYNADFRECKFHRSDAQGESTIEGSAFKNCTFRRCILGGTLFRHVTFSGCTFERCDLGGSQFAECQFNDCIFTECTAENTSFAATEVDPTAFLVGMPPPVYNCTIPTPDGELTESQITAEWVEVRRKLAAQLLRSNTEIHQTDYSDRGLFELKRAELWARVESLRAHRASEGVFDFLLRGGQIGAAGLVLNATKGGTSIFRLVLAAICIVFLYAALLSHSHVKFMGQDCHLNSFELQLLPGLFARATSLFLAFGYTAFSGGNLATVLLTVAASIGLFWYALVAAVVIHRVYR